MIVFAHLLNDVSGSPRVLLAAISAFANAGHATKLYIGSDGNGCLSRCGVPIVRYWYRRTGYRVPTLFTYLFSQFGLFFKLLADSDIDRRAIIYVNTLLPFGAALYGWLTGRRVIYHVHEVSITPVPLRWLLVGVAQLTSDLNIYVSDAHVAALPIRGGRHIRLYNALDDAFATKAFASPYHHRRAGTFKILMVASLRDYKGVPEFLELATRFATMPDVHFDLVVNDEHAAIARYFGGTHVPPNLTVHARVADTTCFYANASLVLNLSRVDEWVETFGLTILEAMAHGVPVIAPPVGGPVELVTHGVHGCLINSRDSEPLYAAVHALYESAALCERYSLACRKRASDFSPKRFRWELLIQLSDFGLNADA